MTITNTVIDIITYQKPPAGDAQFIWTDNPETADQHYRRICAEYPEYLVRQFRSGVEGDDSDLAQQTPTAIDDLIGFHLLADMPLGLFVRERPALIDGHRVMASTVSVTGAQWDAMERLTPQADGAANRLVRPLRADGNVSMLIVDSEVILDYLIRPDGTYTEMNARIDHDAWQGTHDLDADHATTTEPGA
ncbi:hypothetical protein GCM10025867_49020 (plasmid) [Frondihabitans sucicola]|uniref:Uncharacterized protein n=1 Tax=Frondihabitans sucicola TaxID=1268041 RepID=A0ABM8GVZ7_9MICO|nr:hypothetical protein [Frondihabitans sucicola]BDZ52661.1 hypothetical protein GCM10025867_49020 [Frondihabitans sucicola]